MEEVEEVMQHVLFVAQWLRLDYAKEQGPKGNIQRSQLMAVVAPNKRVKENYI